MWLIAHTRFGPVCFLDRVVGVYREHAGGIWTSLSQQGRRARDIETLHHLVPLFSGADRRHLQDLMAWNVGQLLQDPDVDPALLRRSTLLSLRHRLASSVAWSQGLAALLRTRNVR